MIPKADPSPGQRLSDIPLLTATERQQTLADWNRTKREYPSDKCIHQLFEGQVDRTPDTVAVVFEGASLTYRQLNARANQLAHYLRSLGVGPDAVVGLFTERSVETVVAVLATLKAGGAYVPLDPDYPDERLNYFVENSGCRLMLIQAGVAARLPVSRARRIHLDELPDGLNNQNPPPTATPRHLAYLIYTSGSTGRPKGVAMEHRPLVNLLSWQIGQSSPGLRTLQFASMSFDVSFQEIFSTWLSGGTLVLIPARLRPDPAALWEFITTQNLERLFLPVVMLQQLAEAAERSAAKAPGLREIITAGEELRITPAIRALFTAQPSCTLHNHYGPTESHAVTAWTLPGPAASWPDAPCIGRPISNATVYILDADLNPVPVGTAGEIYIGGVPLARGYWNESERTAERFVRDVFDSNPQARLYRTGDSARWLANGVIEFLGRLDQQVKLRGFRIELGEIEAVLGTHPGVSACAVAVHQDDGGAKSLTAFLVPRDASVLAAESLRSWLQQKLPSYMIPSSFVVLESLPRTPNGKVDRKALETSQGIVRAAAKDYVAPRSELERQLAGIWQEVLGQERVGIRDDFLQLGGHSLLAMSIVSRLASLLRRQVPLPWLFEHRTIETLARQIQADGKETEAFVPIQPADRHQALPMSFEQEGMWLLQQTLPDPAVYNQSVAYRLFGAVEASRVRTCLEVILERHEVLRTALVQQGQSLVQRVAAAKDVPLPWKEVDLQAVPPCERQAALEARLLEEARCPFDLAQAPLWRAVWIELAGDERVLAFTFHHSVVDEWSLRLFLREWERLHATDGQIELAGLPELPIQYADYAVWQRQRQELLDQQRGYWRKQLQDLPPALELPADMPRPMRLSGRGAVHEFQLTGSVVSGLRDLGREDGTTLFTVALAAFQVWLHRYTGQTDVLVGTPAGHRERPEVQALLGCFLNPLPIRLRLGGSPGFRQVLRQVRESLLGAFSHADLPFEQIVELEAKERDLGHQPLYQVMFVLLEEGLPALHLDQTEARLVEMRTQTSKTDLTLSIESVGDTWNCRFEYTTDLFTAETAARMGRHLTELLRSIAEDPEKPVSQLMLMPATERDQVLVEWNQTERGYPRDKCVHRLFEAQAERTPDALAVVFGDCQLTYTTLNRRANQLARRLRQLGVGRQTPVAVCVERSPDLIVSLLAILKAGGCYVPLDPTYPVARLELILKDSRTPLLMTPAKWRDRFAPMGVRVCCPDDETAALSVLSEELLDSGGSPTDLAYVIYTSGSTGQPKGVAVPHRAINRLVLNTNYIQLGPGDRVGQVSNAAFDAATFEIWGALLNGAQLVGFGNDVVLSPEDLAAALRAQRITSLFLTTALFNQVARTVPAAFATLRDLLFGGEAVDPPSVRAVLQHGPPRRLLHVYGPTEVTTFATWHRIDAVGEDAATVPIGRPIQNTTAYVLDAQLQPAPIGVAGELYLAGDGLAVGYLNQPQLTAERFVSNPLTPGASNRLYRTGDRVRWRADGTLEFLGRFDQQVKLRGFRIELVEIETALGNHPALRACVVAVQQDPTGEKSLSAFLVPRESSALAVDSLRSWLQQKLPNYMIPSRFVVLESLPLTSNGKVDRNALPGLARSSNGKNSTQPLNLLELELIRIWQRLFQRQDIGRDDNFFAVGGHSLLAVRLSAEIEKLLGRKLPIAVLFQAPTVAALARWLAEEDWAPPWSSLVPLQPLGDKPPFFLVHGKGGGLYVFLGLSRLLSPDQPVYGLQAVGLDGKAARHTTVEEMAAHYVQEIRSFQPEGPYHLGGYSMGGVIAFEVAQQLQRLGQRVALLALLDSAPTGLIPWGFYVLGMASYIPRRCLFHLRRWCRLPRAQRLSYFRGRWAKLKHFTFDRNRSKAAPLPAPPQAESPLPHAPDLADYYYKVASVYRLQPYPGAVNIFVGEDTTLGWKLCWRYLVRGGVSFHRVKGRHDQILSADYVPVLATELKAVLHRAHEIETEKSIIFPVN